jgi:hypothetical protein
MEQSKRAISRRNINGKVKTNKKQCSAILFSCLFIQGLVLLLRLNQSVISNLDHQNKLQAKSSFSAVTMETKRQKTKSFYAEPEVKVRGLDNKRYHLVFSTSCSKNDWQSYLFFYLAMTTRQDGDITHIVSGCDPETEAEMRRLHEEQHTEAMSTNFLIHFTPDFAIKNRFQKTKYWNKPFGVKHWLEHRFGYSWDTEINEVAESTEYDDDVSPCKADSISLVITPSYNY